MKKILITGFEPFGDNKYNPSESVLNLINSMLICDKFETLLLPVSYSKVNTIIESINLDNYSDIVMFGLASDRFQLTYELRAHNFCDLSKYDNDKSTLRDNKIIIGSKEFLYSGFDFDKLEKNKHSRDAGGYVCNYLYYLVQSRINHSVQKSIFIHLPVSEKTSVNYELTEKECFLEVETFLNTEFS